MLDWYAGVFNRGFIALHPFFAVEGLDPSLCAHGTMTFDRSDMPADADLMAWVDQASADHRKGKELFDGSIPAVAKRFGSVIGWREICAATGLSDHCALDLALRTHIKGLRRDLRDESAMRAMTAYCDREKIFLPTEGELQPVMEHALVAMLRRAGLEEVIIADEFGEEERQVRLDSLAGEHAWRTRADLLQWGIRHIRAPDASLLVWVHWDSFFTAIFGTEERFRGARVSDGFEGFWCSERTTTYWLFEEPVPLVG